jgi:hypothetical protein
VGARTTASVPAADTGEVSREIPPTLKYINPMGLYSTPVLRR